jgi:hypothetical protein
MARREGLYEVDGELVSERTSPVRWRALSYTQPMFERAPGRGKGKLMRVMFDSNTTRFAPLRRARDKSARSKHASCRSPLMLIISSAKTFDVQPDSTKPRTARPDRDERRINDLARSTQFVPDSLLEGTGFEPSVPLRGKPFSRPFRPGDRRFWLQEADITRPIETDLIPPAAEIGTLRLSKRSARRQVDAVEAVHMPNAGADAVADSRLVPVSFALGGAE